MDEKGFNPFADRSLQSGATSDNDIRMHLIKSALGSGILSMPYSFLNSGLILGVISTVVIGVVCTHCAHILVECAHKLYYRDQRTAMTYAEVSQKAFMSGPKITQNCANGVRNLVVIGLFLAYWGTCSVYTVIIAKTFQKSFEYWINETYNDRLLIASLLLPCVILTWIPNYKKLSPVSIIANIFIFSGLGITFCYIIQDLPPIQDRKYFVFANLPIAYSITIFAVQLIGVVLPLENSMVTPPHLLGCFGILSQGLSCVVVLCMIIGFTGYWAYGDETEQSITLNLPVDEIPAQIVNILIALAVFCTFGLQFTVCMEVVWNGIKLNFQKNPIFANYVLRTLLSSSAVGVAVAVPTITPFMGLVGAFCFSILGLILPGAIEMALNYETGYGSCFWILWKDILIILFGITALIFGSRSSINDIIDLYN